MDCRFVYARDSLLAYSRWMADHEYPFLEKPDVLEFPNETWAAQDMRKADVFLYVSRHATSDIERSRFQDRADDFYRASLSKLVVTVRDEFVRQAVVLLLSHRFMHSAAASRVAWFQPRAVRRTASTRHRYASSRRRRSRSSAGLLFGLTAVAVLVFIVWLFGPR